MKRLFTTIAVLMVAVCTFAGDAAAFVDLGFSRDGKTYVFGQYGKTDGNFHGYAEIYTVDVKLNDFVSKGVFKTTDKSGKTGSEVFSKLKEKHKSFLNSYGLTPVDADYKDDGAEFDHNKALTERDTLVTEFITVVTAEKLIYGYEYNITYKSLEDEYNLEVKQAIAKIVYNDMLKKYVKFVGELPKSAVNEVYEELIDNYQFCFYQNYDVETHSDRSSSSSSSSSSTDKETYYDMYDGSFERFMIELAVPKTLGVQAPASYDEAKALVRARAGEIVKDRISVYVMAAALDAKLTNGEFDEYVEENGLSYADDKTIASHRLARQLVKVLDKILESEEKKAEESGNRFAPTLVTYNKNFIKELVKE